MKRLRLWTVALLLCAVLSACGGEEAGATAESMWKGGIPEEGMSALAERTEYYDLTLKQEELFDLELWDQNVHDEFPHWVIYSGGTVYLPLGSQFYQGEPVQLWAESSSKGTDIYLYGRDGTGRLVLEGVPNAYASYGDKSQWYIDEAGDFYCRSVRISEINGERVLQGVWVKILSSGEILPENKLEPEMTVKDICQTKDGRVYLLLENMEQEIFLEEVDTATGQAIPESRVEIPLQFQVAIGDGGDLPAVMGSDLEDPSRRIVRMNPAEETLSLALSFTGTSYEPYMHLSLQDFQVLEDGSVELLWTQRDGTGGLLEQLKMEKVEKEVLVLRGIFWHDEWLTRKIYKFNSENSEYHVILEDGADSDDWEDFFRLTSVQIGAGKGPDILGGGSLPQGYVSGMLEKEALEDLAPYMAASGIREEDYFPPTFATWRQGDKIYGVNSRISLLGEMIDAEVLGSKEIPDIETLADALLALEKDGVYYEGWGSGQILESFLRGTDSLWGMVDWENGTCNFHTPLFGKLLEAARRHCDDGRKNPESTMVTRRYIDCLLDYGRNSEGKVTCGVLFDDGCYVASLPSFTLAVNAKSPHKDGAWAFILSLISEEAQLQDMEYHEVPVNRKAYAEWMDWCIYELTEVKLVNGAHHYPSYYGTDVSEERHEEFLKELESARPMPVRTAPIIDIILEEAEDYFRGYKNAEEISRIVGNRVQLYLDEHK